MRIQLTKEFRKVSTSYGLFQNLSGDANIELTENVQSDGIILRPFQIVTVNRTFWAKKISGAGTGVLAVLPFVDSEDSSDEPADENSGDETGDVNPKPPPLPPPHHPPSRPPRPPAPNPYDCFEAFHPEEPPHPHDDEDGYVIQIPRALIERGQHKFVVDFPR